MINFDNIENSLRHEIADDNGDGSCDLTNTALLELITLIHQAEKDAARYRWLRDEARHHMDGAPLAFMTNYDGEPIAYPECGMVLHESYLDEAIDEAMQCK